MSLLDIIGNTFARMSETSVTIFNATTATSVNIPQGFDTGFPILYNSRDEPQGSTFSYSTWLFIGPDTFEDNKPIDANLMKVKKLKHIFHKGSENAFPNLGPAVFVESDTNTLRVYMNTIDSWNNYVVVPNVPVGKWFHLVVSLKGKNIDVYINGNVSVRMKLATAPKLNNGSLYILKSLYFPDRADYDKALFSDYTIDGAMKGRVSRMNYYAYALNYSQIDSLYREGPNTSSVLEPAANRASDKQQPPYFFDTWWTNRY
jgi:hypothetical protein